MKRNNKLAILIVLMIAAIFAWIPKGKKPVAVSANTFERATPVTRAAPRKRTEFVDWGRNPFARTQIEEKVGDISNMTVLAIIWDGEKAEAMINESIVCVGDKITDKTVKQIEQNRVILTDGANDYVLELK